MRTILTTRTALVALALASPWMGVDSRPAAAQSAPPRVNAVALSPDDRKLATDPKGLNISSNGGLPVKQKYNEPYSKAKTPEA